jgi:hypothetical protein
MIYDNHHPPLWLRDHPHIPTPGKVVLNKGRKTTPTTKEKQSSRFKKREVPSTDSPAQASKKKKTTTARASRGVIILGTDAQDPLPVEKSAAQGISAPVSKKPVRKTRVGKRTFVPLAFLSVPTSIAARVAARKSTRGIVYSEKRVCVFILASLFVN